MSQWYHSKKWRGRKGVLVFRGETAHNTKKEPLEPKYEAEAAEMLQDWEYEKKYMVLVERLMSGKRIAGRMTFNSPVWRD